MMIQDSPDTAPSKHRRSYNVAYASAFSSPGVGGRNRNTYRLGACLVHRNIIVASGMNSYKTHRLTAQYGKYPYLHAEQATIFRRGLDNCGGASLYIVRVRRDGHIGTSKPCSSCRQVIKDARIKEVYHT